MTQDLITFPIRKSDRCPFDPSPTMMALDRPTKVRLWDGSTPWLINDFELTRRLLVDQRVSADSTMSGYPHFDTGSRERRKDGRSFVAMDDPEHARLRRMVAPPFNIRNVEALRPRVQEIVDAQIDELLSRPRPVDLVNEFAFLVSTRVICLILGVPFEDHEFFQSHATAMLHRDSSPEIMVGAQEELRAYLRRLIAARLDDPDDGLLSSVAAAHVTTGELTEVELSYIAVTLLVAGLETTGNMIALGTLALLRHPDQLDLMRDTSDPLLVRRAVDELLRFLNISHSGRRRVALADIELDDGLVIGEGEGMILASESANRDGDNFTDPDRLDIRRDAAHHLAFGFGPHHCLGRPLATLELEAVYSTLYRRIDGLRLAVPFEDVPFKHDGVAYGLHELLVTW